MPIDPALLATSIGTLGDLEPEPDLPAALQRAVTAAKQLLDADAAGITLTDATGGLHWASASDQRTQAVENNQEPCAAGPCAEAFTTGRPAVMYDAYQERRRGGPWGEISLAIAELEPRSALSVPIDLGDGPIGTLDLYATNPRGWDHTDVCALQTYAGVVASLLGAAATAHIGGGLADQLQVALASRCSAGRVGHAGSGSAVEGRQTQAKEGLDEHMDKVFDRVDEVPPGPGREVSDEEREGVPATDTEATSPLGVGESMSRRGEDIARQEDEPGREDTGTQGPSDRPVGVSDERDSTAVDPN